MSGFEKGRSINLSLKCSMPMSIPNALDGGQSQRYRKVTAPSPAASAMLLA